VRPAINSGDSDIVGNFLKNILDYDCKKLISKLGNQRCVVMYLS
jgi:hypothetical protein